MAEPSTPATSCGEALDQAERLLVSGAFPDAASAAQRVLADCRAAAASGAEEDDAEDLTLAAAAVLLQARSFAGDAPATLRSLLLDAFGSLRAVPPDALVLWARLALKAGEADAARATLVEALAYEPGERLGHAHESLAAASRMLAVDVCTSALGDAAGALKWLAVDGAAVMTTDARRALMHEINARKEADDAAAAEKLRAAAAALAAARSEPADAAPSNAAALEAAAASAWGVASAQAAAAREAVAAAPLRQQMAPRQQSVAASLRSLIQRGSAAARADPEKAFIYVAMGVGAIHMVLNERRALRSNLHRAGQALAHLL